MPQVWLPVVVKPEYRIPLMGEIAAVPENGLTVLSTFTGTGGSCLGFRWAGYRTVAACEFVEAARESYALNFPDVPVEPGDIRGVTGGDLLALGGVSEVDVLEGSPPCASFSTAGRRQAGWGEEHVYSDTRQRVDDLFDEYVRVLGEVRPRAFVAENVSGLVKGAAKGYFLEIIAGMRAKGYRVGARVLDAQWLGVPQRRQRVIFVGLRDDVPGDPPFPMPLPYRYSIRDALPNLRTYRFDTSGKSVNRGSAGDVAYAVTNSGGMAYHHHQVTGEPLEDARVVDGMGSHFTHRDIPLDGPAPTIPAQIQGRTGIKIVGGPGSPFANKGREFDPDEPIAGINTPSHHFYVEGDGPPLGDYAIGAEYDRLSQGESSDKYLNLVRPDVAEPCPTVTQLGGSNPGVASVTHPTERRKFTIAELRRLCGFPDDFALAGDYSQQWERLGRAVPPPMARAVAEALLSVLA